MDDTVSSFMSIQRQRFTDNPNNPRQIHLAYTEDPTGMLFQWVTGVPDWNSTNNPPPPFANNPIVRIGISSQNYTVTVNSNYSFTYNNTGDIIHRVNISGLQYSTRYYYIVGDDVLNLYSNESSFLHRPVTDPDSPVNFLLFADMSTSSAASIVCSQMTEALSQNDYHFALHPGDLSYAGPSARNNITEQTLIWDRWFDLIEPISRQVPYMSGVGNHDVNMDTANDGGECGVAVAHRFKMPYQNESLTDFGCLASHQVRYWYSFIVGSVWIQMISTQHPLTPSSEQLQWIEEDLQAAQQAKQEGKISWIIVAMHYTTYCSHSYPSCYTYDAAENVLRLGPTLEATWLASEVDIVAFGHVHALEITWPLFNGTTVQKNYINPKAPVHTLIGMSGAGYLGPWNATIPDWSNYREQLYGYSRIHVYNRSVLHFEYIGYDDNQVHFQFDIERVSE